MHSDSVWLVIEAAHVIPSLRLISNWELIRLRRASRCGDIRGVTEMAAEHLPQHLAFALAWHCCIQLSQISVSLAEMEAALRHIGLCAALGVVVAVSHAPEVVATGLVGEGAIPPLPPPTALAKPIRVNIDFAALLRFIRIGVG